MVTVGLLATLHAAPGKEDEVASFLAGALPLAQAEHGTVAWCCYRIDETTFGIFERSATPTPCRPISTGTSRAR